MATILTFMAMVMCGYSQNNKAVTRIARITIDSLQLHAYTALLTEQMESAIRLEPGVWSYEVYADKADPAKMTILEVYADDNAYRAHLQTPHFKKYKSAVSKMVLNLELSEVELVNAVKQLHKK